MHVHVCCDWSLAQSRAPLLLKSSYLTCVIFEAPPFVMSPWQHSNVLAQSEVGRTFRSRGTHACLQLQY